MKSSEPKLRFDHKCVPYWASKYEYGEINNVTKLVKKVRKRGYLRRSELITVCEWKSLRPARYLKENEESLVQEVTRFALKTEYDKAAIESLTILYGVGEATASVILHFFHEKDYPIWDFRALWSVSLIDGNKYNYSYALWSEYVEFCRKEANKAGACMRVLDRVLWQYSKCNQPKSKLN